MVRLVKYLLCISLAFSFAYESYAEKSTPIKPKWLTHKLPSEQSEGYIFVKAHGIGNTLDAARQNALVNLSNYLETNHGLTISSTLKSTTSEIISGNSSNNWTQKSELTLEVEEKGKKINITCRTIDEYWDCKNDRCCIDVLYTVETPVSSQSSYHDDISVTSKYGARGLLSIIPGVGQFYKGSYVKGSIFLASEIAAITSLIICENTRVDYNKKMIEQPQYAKEYNSRASKWKTGRNICIGVAGAVYVTNLIDALVTEGAKRVVVKKNKTTFALTPYIASDATGIAMVFNF